MFDVKKPRSELTCLIYLGGGETVISVLKILQCKLILKIFFIALSSSERYNIVLISALGIFKMFLSNYRNIHIMLLFFEFSRKRTTLWFYKVWIKLIWYNIPSIQSIDICYVYKSDILTSMKEPTWLSVWKRPIDCQFKRDHLIISVKEVKWLSV